MVLQARCETIVPVYVNNLEIETKEIYMILFDTCTKFNGNC